MRPPQPSDCFSATPPRSKDSDYPVADLSSLRRFLWLNNGSNFVNVGSAYKASTAFGGLGMQMGWGRLVGQSLNAITCKRVEQS